MRWLIDLYATTQYTNASSAEILLPVIRHKPEPTLMNYFRTFLDDCRFLRYILLIKLLALKFANGALFSSFCAYLQPCSIKH